MAGGRKRVWFTNEQIARVKRLREGGYSLREISERVGRSKSTISKLIIRGYKRHTFGERPRPGDLSLQAAHLTFNQLKAHYHCGAPMLCQWLAEASVTLPNRQYVRPLRECPPDFAEMAGKILRRELQTHYRATGDTITRWKRQCGLKLRSDKPNVVSMVGWAERYVAERLAA